MGVLGEVGNKPNGADGAEGIGKAALKKLFI